MEMEYDNTIDLMKGPQILGIIGHPISHSLSPLMYNFMFRKLNLNYAFKGFDIPEDKLEFTINAMRLLNFKGISVTHPHKVSVMKFLDEICDDAMNIGAVNTIQIKDNKLIGFNTDGDGYVKSLQQETGIQLKNKKVLLFGAGGAGYAIGYKLSQTGIKELYITDKNINKAKQLAAKLNQFVSTTVIDSRQLDDLSKLNINLFINATPIGMDSEKISKFPVSLEQFERDVIISDVIYSPPETLLLKEAKKNGFIVHRGAGMLVQQGVFAFEIWTGIKPSESIMQQSIDDALKKIFKRPAVICQKNNS